MIQTAGNLMAHTRTRHTPTAYLTDRELVRCGNVTTDRLNQFREQAIVRPSIRPADGSRPFRWGLADLLAVRIFGQLAGNGKLRTEDNVMSMSRRPKQVNLDAAQEFHPTLIKTMRYGHGKYMDELPALYAEVYLMQGDKDNSQPILVHASTVPSVIRQLGGCALCVRLGGYIAGINQDDPDWQK